MMQFLHQSPSCPHTLSSSNAISPISLLPKLTTLSLSHLHRPPSTLIRMGGGPRTYPGGVSKWQWKRMQAKKAKQLLKARLSRERQIYEMRKRAELKAAVSDLERPWEVVQKGAPKTSSSLFAVSADEQLKVLADRFQKPGGFDMWSDNDGPQIFHTHESLPSARFFPKGVVHSVKPYVSSASSSGLTLSSTSNRKTSADSSHLKGGVRKLKELRGEVGSGLKPSRKSSAGSSDLMSENGGVDRKRGDHANGGGGNGRNMRDLRKREGNVEGRAKMISDTNPNVNKRNDRSRWFAGRRNKGRSQLLGGREDVHDMSLQGDGSYGFIGSKNG